MNNLTQLDFQAFRNGMPAGVDPFLYINGEISKKMSIKLGFKAQSFLKGVFAFHFLTSAFCAAVFILPFCWGSARGRWFCRRLYIQDSTGTNVYKKPLYMLNAGSVMTVAQLLSSISAQCAIWIQIENSRKRLPRPDYLVFLGLMNVFELCTYWSITHCFWLTSYACRRANNRNPSNRAAWINIPMMINFCFLCLPLAATVAIFFFTSKNLITFQKILDDATGLQTDIQEGSLTWQRMQDLSSAQEKIDLANQMAQVGFEMKASVNQVMADVNNFIESYKKMQLSTMIIFCVTFPVFIYSFGRLVQHYTFQSAKSSPPPSNQSEFLGLTQFEKNQNLGEAKCSQEDQRDYYASLSSSQFLFVGLRASAIALGMLISISSNLVAITRARDAVLNIHWRDTVVCLTTLGSICTALPISGQCWRLYMDQMHSKKKLATPPGSGQLKDVLSHRTTQLSAEIVIKMES